MLRAATRSGLMKLFLLTCGDRIAAASVNFVRGDRMQAYMTSYDPAFDRASPGAILIVRYTRWAFDNGLKQVDFLRGDEAFKSRLANAEINLASYVGVRTAIGKTALVAHHLRSWFRGAGSVARAEPAAVGSAASGSPHLGSGT
jgi:CelD/BcsL family acetyltransferase involved in cellulose biosynthesis